MDKQCLTLTRNLNTPSILQAFLMQLRISQFQLLHSIFPPCQSRGWVISNFYMAWELVACENIRFSLLFAAGDVSRGGTSATHRQKFHTDDVKSVRNTVRSADWSTEWLHCFSYCLRMTDKRQKATKVKCKCAECLAKQSIFVEYTLLQEKRLSFAGAHWQMNTTLYQNRPEDT